MEKSKKDELAIALIGIVVGFILSLGAVYFGFWLHKDYLQSINPDIEIFTKEEQPLRMGVYELVQPPNGKRFSFCVRNTGKIETSVIQGFLIKDSSHNLSMDIVNLPRISEGVACDWESKLRMDKCFTDQEGVKEGCDEGDIPIGRQTLTIEFECNECVGKQKNFNKSFEICIWNNSGGGCP